MIIYRVDLAKIREIIQKLNTNDEFAIFREGIADFIKNDFLKQVKKSDKVNICFVLILYIY